MLVKSPILLQLAELRNRELSRSSTVSGYMPVALASPARMDALDKP